MNQTTYLQNLIPPVGSVDVVLDTDAYNEIDDQYAISYLLTYGEKLDIKGICAAPFLNHKVQSAAEGMEKSFREIHKILKLAGREDLIPLVYRGSERFHSSEEEPVISDSSKFMAELANRYTPERPLYIIALGAITNVSSALLMNPKMKENSVIVWLGGHAHHMPDTREFNMKQDVAGARVLFGCGVPVVQLPCKGVVDVLRTSRYELEHWLLGKNPLCDYLVENTIREAESYAAGKPWTRVIWDVTPIAWLVNKGGCFMTDDLRPSPVPEYEHTYRFDDSRHLIRYVTSIQRDAVFEDLFRRLGEGKWC
jgi:inosine-uridine nucleoside N-ribohydrolase